MPNTTQTSFVSPNASPADLDLIEATHAFATDALRATRTPGMSIALARSDGILSAQALGEADPERGTPMTLEHTFRVGSISKTYIAVAVMQLVERGVIDLYAPASAYLPNLALQNHYGERDVTVYDLVTYRGGLTLDTGDQALQPAPLGSHLEQAFRAGTRPEYGRERPLWVEKVGESYNYSTLGMAAAAYLVERTNPERLSFAEYVRRWISGPLGMNATGFPRSEDGMPPQELMARLATGYARFGAVHVPSPILHAAASPAVSLLTTPMDHARLHAAFLNGGSLGDAQILKASTLATMITPHVEMGQAADAGWWNGIGFEMTRVGERGFNYGHGGAHSWGWYGQCAAYHHYDLAIVACTNRWEMPRFYNPLGETAPGLVLDFLASWLAGESAARDRPRSERPWVWRASYAMGLLMVERTNGTLGVSESMPLDVVERMAGGAFASEGRLAEIWDEEAFRAGVLAMQEVEQSPAAIRSFLSDGCAEITYADLPLLALWFGQKPSMQLPMRFFADANSPRGVVSKDG